MNENEERTGSRPAAPSVCRSARHRNLMPTLCAGLLRGNPKRRFLRIHRTLVFTTVVLAALHALTVLLGH